MRFGAFLFVAIALVAGAGCHDDRDDATGIRPSTSVAPGEWVQNPSNGHWYMRTEPLTWSGAEAFALSNHGHLVTLNDAAEEAWVRETFGADQLMWIGMNDLEQEGTWVWSSGEAVSYTNWGSVEPNNCGAGGGHAGCNDENFAVMNWCREGGIARNPCIGDVWNDLGTGLAPGIVESKHPAPASVWQSASGHMQVSLDDPDIPFERYSFSAIKRADGSVRGRFVVYDPKDAGAITRGRVTCLTILPDNKTARVGGIIDESSYPGIVPGMETAWFVEDNGEGEGADVGSDLRFGFAAGSGRAQLHCQIGLMTVMRTRLSNEHGNVQVRENALARVPMRANADVAPAACASSPDYIASSVPELRHALDVSAPGDVIAVNGTILTDTSVPFNRPGVTITCATPGAGIAVLPGFAPNVMISISASDVTLKGLVLDGRTFGSTSAVYVENSATMNGARPQLIGNLFRCGRGACVFLVGTSDAVVSGNRIVTGAGATSGLHVQRSVSGATFNVDRSRITDNTFIAEAPSGNALFGAVRVRDGEGVYVADNVVRGPWQNGIAPAELRNSRFERNDLSGALLYAFRLAANTTGFPSMTGNTFHANRIGTSGEAGFLVANACSNTFAGNSIAKDATPYAAVFNANTGANVYAGNSQTVVDNGAADCNADGRIDANRINGTGKVVKNGALGQQSGSGRGDEGLAR